MKAYGNIFLSTVIIICEYYKKRSYLFYISGQALSFSTEEYLAKPFIANECQDIVKCTFINNYVNMQAKVVINTYIYILFKYYFPSSLSVPGDWI